MHFLTTTTIAVLSASMALAAPVPNADESSTLDVRSCSSKTNWMKNPEFNNHSAQPWKVTNQQGNGVLTSVYYQSSYYASSASGSTSALSLHLEIPAGGSTSFRLQQNMPSIPAGKWNMELATFLMGDWPAVCSVEMYIGSLSADHKTVRLPNVSALPPPAVPMDWDIARQMVDVPSMVASNSQAGYQITCEPALRDKNASFTIFFDNAAMRLDPELNNC